MLRALLLLLGLLPFALFGCERALGSDRVLRGVWIDDLPLSGLHRDEARRALQQLAHRLELEKLSVQVGSEIFEVEPGRLGLRVDVERTLGSAMSLGRKGSIVSQLGWWFSRWSSGMRAPVVARVDHAAIETSFAQWEAQAIGDLPADGGVVVHAGQPIPLYPRTGRLIVRTEAKNRLISALGASTRQLIELPIAVVPPKVGRAEVERAVANARKLLDGSVELFGDNADANLVLSPAELGEALTSRIAGNRLELDFDPRILDLKIEPYRQKIEMAPVDASFVVESVHHVRVEPSRRGTRLRMDELGRAVLGAAQAENRRAPLPPVVVAEPKFTTEQAESLRIKRLISQFTTRFACCQPRVENIRRISELMNDTIVEPGETFSVNERVGPRTVDNGFVSAPSIEDGEMVDSVGGGISQFATTLFNAVFHGGYDIIERQPHSYWFPRYPMGHEATLSWPKPDVIFRNDTDAGMLIKCSTGKTSVTVAVYGDNGGRRIEPKVSGQREITKPPVELVANPTLSPAREKVKESGSIGWSVVVSRTVTFRDGTTKKEERKVVYKPRPRRIEVHPCRIPRGEPGHTGEICPVPPDLSEASGDETSETTDGHAPN
jgi:vancomycin resistance protein YoaR